MQLILIKIKIHSIKSPRPPDLSCPEGENYIMIITIEMGGWKCNTNLAISSMFEMFSHSNCNTNLPRCFQAEEFSSRIQKLANQGPAADRELMGPRYWMS